MTNIKNWFDFIVTFSEPIDLQSITGPLEALPFTNACSLAPVDVKDSDLAFKRVKSTKTVNIENKQLKLIYSKDRLEKGTCYKLHCVETIEAISGKTLGPL
jgi:hypothetical protein